MARVDRVVTSGTFSLDGGTWDVDNNVWIIGDDDEVVIIDPAHEPDAIVAAVNGRRVAAILLTHGHDDHIRAVDDVKRAFTDPGSAEPPVYFNPNDHMLWEAVYPDAAPDVEVREGATFNIAGVTLRAIHTPGHSPGSTCWFADSLDWQGNTGPTLFSGDTLFHGGPGATGRSYSSFETIIESITNKLFALPDETVVLTGHGDATTIGAERPHLQEWLDRGH